MNTEIATKMDTLTLFELWQSMQNQGVPVCIVGVGGQAWNGYVCVAWARDRRGEYRYLCVRGGQ
jgi:hypothetical protein